MYLYAHDAKGDKVFSRRIQQMNYETTRLLLSQKFPGARILSPLESKHAGPMKVINVYGSRIPDGRDRCTSFEQWGIQDIEAVPLSQDEIRHMAEHIYRWTFKHLIETTTMSRPEAMHKAVDSANTYAEALGLELCHCGTPVRDESNTCRTCGNPIDHALTEVNL